MLPVSFHMAPLGEMHSCPLCCQHIECLQYLPLTAIPGHRHTQQPAAHLSPQLAFPASLSRIGLMYATPSTIGDRCGISTFALLLPVGLLT